MKRLFFPFILFAVFGCTEPKQTVVAKATDEKKWGNTVSLWYNNEDTLAERDIALMIRYNDRFEDATVGVAVGITTPGKKLFRDTLTMNVKKKTRINGVKVEEDYTPIFKNARLLEKGFYCISVSPLNDPPLEGIVGIGILF